MTPEIKSLEIIQSKIGYASALLSTQDAKLTEQIKETENQYRKLQELNRQILSAEEIIEFESFALYRPRYDFATRELRAQQREEAKLEKEIAASRKEAEKERKHYHQALEKLKTQMTACTTDEERENLERRSDEIVGYLDDISTKLEDMDYRQSNQKAGYVYIISNIGSFGENVYKIGMTRRLEPMERVYELGDASVPFIFDVHAMIFSDNAPQLEAALHRAFDSKRINSVNTRREYFRVTLDEIKSVVLANHDKTVEFIDIPSAQQYRETLKMRAVM